MANAKLVLTEPVNWGSDDGVVMLASGDECPPELAKILPEGYVMKESEYKKVVAESEEPAPEPEPAPSDDDGA